MSAFRREVREGFPDLTGWPLEKTHDIVEVLAWCADHDTELGTMVDEGAVLNEYIVVGRYPGDIALEPIGAGEAEETLAAAKRIRARVRHLMEGA